MKLPTQGAYIATTKHFQSFDTNAQNAGQGITPSVCVTARVRRGRACLQLPIKIPFIGDQVCLPAPGVPNLGSVSGCCNLRKSWGIPTGVKCCLKFRGSNIACRSFP